MGIKDKNKTINSDANSANGSIEETLDTARRNEASSNKSDKEVLRSYFAQVDLDEQAIEEARATLESCLMARSATLRKILDHPAGGPGPYRYKGDVVKIVARKGKGGEGETLFFRGRTKVDAIDI